MADIHILSTEKTKRASRHEALREKFFAKSVNRVWNRKQEKGFCTIPRTLSLIMTLLNILDKKNDMSRVYFELWCRAFDEGLIDVTDEAAIAYESGYTLPSRNVRTWRERIAELERWGFIETKKVGSARFRYILLIHPHIVILSLRERKMVPEEWDAAFESRITEIGTTMPKKERQVKQESSKA